MRRISAVLLPAVALAVTLPLAACGSSSSNPGGGGATNTTNTATPAASTGTAAAGTGTVAPEGCPPAAGTTARILEALARECVRATFFLIGRNAAGLPDLAARTAREGHSIANHTWSHPWTIDRLSHDKGLAEIDNGAAAISRAIGSAGRLSPFVRFPGFVETPALLAELGRRNIATFGADLWASDWNPMTPEAQLSLVLGRVELARRGIVLFHDTKEQTAAMIPAFLRELKRRGYKVVHVVGR